MIRAMKVVSLVALCTLIVAVPPARAHWVQDGAGLCTAAGDQRYPTIVSDGAGGAIVTWYDFRGGSADIYAQRVNASGAVQWTADGVALCTATGDQQFPTIVSDGAGGAIVTWQDQRSGNWDIYAQKVNASGAVQWATEGVALCTATGEQSYPRIASDGAGGAIVTWPDWRLDNNWNIYAQRVNASGAVQWTTDGVALCTARGTQYSPMITSDGAGGAIVTWTDQRGLYEDIYAQRVNASGSVQWTTDGVALCTAAGIQYSPMITSDGAGGAIVTWYGSRNGSDHNIYVQRVNASGAVQWTSDGVALCTATADQSYATIASDGAGGAIVTWRDWRDGLYWGIFAQRVNASGAGQWTGDGVALCTATGDQAYPQIASDGAGGAIVTWHGRRNGSTDDIYAQRVNDSGVVEWTANGVVLCTATAAQSYPTIASDGAGGAIVTWQDFRSGTDRDIFAQRVDANGFAVLTGTDVPAAPVELHQNYPNPFNPTTTVTYSVPEECVVKLEIYDVSGKRIACLADGQQEKGSHSVEWSGKDAKGNSVASGIYVYRLEAGGQTISRKMVLLR